MRRDVLVLALALILPVTLSAQNNRIDTITPLAPELAPYGANDIGGRPLHDPDRYWFGAALSSFGIVYNAESLRRLGVETIDLYQLHRPDWLMNPDEVAVAFGQLRQQGKVREFGVSNFRPAQLTALQRALAFPLVVNQVEISLANLGCFNDGTLDQCLAERITPMAWSPLEIGRAHV